MNTQGRNLDLGMTALRFAGLEATHEIGLNQVALPRAFAGQNGGPPDSPPGPETPPAAPGAPIQPPKVAPFWTPTRVACAVGFAALAGVVGYHYLSRLTQDAQRGKALRGGE